MKQGVQGRHLGMCSSQRLMVSMIEIDDFKDGAWVRSKQRLGLNIVDAYGEKKGASPLL